MSTLKDIAKEAGVSVCTISRYINNKIKVKPETARKIDEAIERLHYIPNNAAKTLKTNSSHNIAILIPTMNNLLFAESTEAIQAVLNQNGYSVFIYSFGNDIQREKMLIPRLIENRVAGVIFNTLASNYDDLSHLDILDSHHIPYVLINRLFEKNHTPAVNVDYRKGAYIATSHLLEKGKRRLGLFLGKVRQPQSKINLDGYQDALAAHELPYDEELVKECMYQHDLIAGQVDELLEKGVDGVHCLTDFMAVHVIERLKERGVSIPDEVAVIGTGNTRYTTIIEPHMTTVDIHNQEVGRTAADLLFKLILGEQVKTIIKTDIRLVKRDST